MDKIQKNLKAVNFVKKNLIINKKSIKFKDIFQVNNK